MVRKKRSIEASYFDSQDILAAESVQDAMKELPLEAQKRVEFRCEDLRHTNLEDAKVVFRSPQSDCSRPLSLRARDNIISGVGVAL